MVMEYVETKDPFGFVGSHVVQNVARGGRRRQRAGSMKPDPGDLEDSDLGAVALHGWVTRYDVRLDAYTLFKPGEGTSLHSRGDIMKFISNPEFQLRTEPDEAFPPPVEDSTSRFVGAPVIRTSPVASGQKRKKRGSAQVGEEAERGSAVDGAVVCFLPFRDRYRVSYDDGLTTDVSESEVLDGVIAFARRAKEKLAQGAEAARGEANASPPKTKKRRRSVEPPPPALDDDEETEDEDLMSSTGIKSELVPADAPLVVEVDASAWQSSGVEEAAIPAAVGPPDAVEPPAEEVVEVDPHEPMELVLMDDDDDDGDQDMKDVNAAMSSMSTTSVETNNKSSGSAVEVVSLVDDEEEPSAPRPVYYVVEHTPHVATSPFDTRARAFEFLRQQLIRLLGAEECKSLDTSLVSGALGNKDVKDRDAVRRFVESGGLVVLNKVLNGVASNALKPPSYRYDCVLVLLKLLAMLPTPSERQVMESSIGKTIGRLIKSRLHDQQNTADQQMPKSIAHLAKWVKHKWLANMQRDGKSTKKNSVTPSQKRMQRPTQGRPPGQRNDPVPIPRRSSPQSSAPLPPLPPVTPFASQPNDVLGDALASSPRWQQQAPPNRSSLKPDWIRQKENLRRTRFKINTDAYAEREHYQRDREQNAAARSGAGASNNRRGEDAGAGDRGVFGRHQRLSFGPRWSVCEFFKDTPPSAVRRTNGPSMGRTRPPRSILRKTSKYRDDLSF